MTQPSPHWWGILLAAAQVCGLGSLYAWSVLIAPVQAYFDVGRTETGLVFSVGMAVFTLAVLAAPRLFAGRRLAVVGTMACLLGAAGLGVAALVTSFVPFLVAYGCVFAAASGLGYAAGLQQAVASRVARPGLAMGVVVAAFALGAVLLGPIMGRLGDARGLAAALWLPAAVLLAIGFTGYLAQRRFPALQLVYPRRGAVVEGAEGADPQPGRRLVLLLWCGFAFGAAGGLMVLGHAASIVSDQGGTLALAGLAVSMIAAGNALGRLSSGLLADGIGPRNVLILSALLLALATGLMSTGPGAAVSSAALALAGLSYGTMATGYPVAVNALLGPRVFAHVYGWVFTAWGLAGLIAPFAAGWIFDRTGDYRLALQAAALCGAASVLCVLRLPRRMN